MVTRTTWTKPQSFDACIMKDVRVHTYKRAPFMNTSPLHQGRRVFFGLFYLHSLLVGRETHISTR